jgi:Tannase-like family of unknown function (DUF6351)
MLRRGRRTLVGTTSVGTVAALAAVGFAIPGASAEGGHGRTGKPRRTVSGHAPVIIVISSRADLVSGGEALVSVSLPTSANPARLKMLLNGRNVTSQFAVRANGLYEGLLSGLRVGRNRLVAKLHKHASGKVILVDHSVGGPLFSGPQVQPWMCTNGSKDSHCNAPTTYSYEYMSSVTHSFQTYNPKSPPADVDTITTQTGAKVPFIVRFETGYQDRDQYQIAVVYQPGKPWTAWAPQPQFNHKLLITHGASCGIDHESGTAPSTTGDTVGVPGGPSAGSSPTTALSMGFAVMSTALDNAGHNCNVVTEAESLVMAKEHLIAHYGTLRYTIGTGCSGGSLVQQQVANAYPGVYQGILPQCSFPDAWSTGQELAGYHLTRGYFENPTKWGTGIVWTPTQIAAVEGHPNHGNAIIFDTVYWNSLANPSNDCNGVPKNELYNAQSRPGGVRCTLTDYMINVFGPRPRREWQAAEHRVGHGFGDIPLDDVGVEFGLNALKDGTISPAQFVDVNAKIGGEDLDLNFTAARTAADHQALRNDYRSGSINETNNLVNVPIIDLRGPDPGAFHDAYRSWTIRARLEAQEGHFPTNDVIWFGETPLIGDPNYTVEGLEAMDRWLSAVEADHRNIPLETKVADDRPADVHDQCSDVPELQLVNVPGVGEVCELPLAQTKFATPAMEAGESIATDVEKCQLVPLRESSFYPITFTAAEWAQLEQAFPSGVCDYTKRGVEQQNTIPWQTYQANAAGSHVIYGGKPLGPAPANSGSGWTSPSFDWWLRS